MKVIQGPTKWQTEIKCRCGAVLQVDDDDVTTRFFGASWGGDTPEEKTCVICCVCGETIELEVPPRIERAAKEASAKRRKNR